MLLTALELCEKLQDLDLGMPQLAFLISTKIVAHPPVIRLKDGLPLHLFDDSDVAAIRSALDEAKTCSAIEIATAMQRWKPDSLLQGAAGQSEGIRAAFEWDSTGFKLPKLPA